METKFIEYESDGIDVNNIYFTKYLITYIGNKRSLLPFLKKGFDDVRKSIGKREMVCLDGFSGSGCVSRLLKYYSSSLHTNDLEKYVETINKCYLQSRYNPSQNINLKDIRDQIFILNKNKYKKVSSTGIIRSLYSPIDDNNIKKEERVFYTNKNADIIDNIRQQIEFLPDNIKPFCLAPLLVEASIHVNTSGVFKGFHKNKKGIGQFGGKNRVALERICGEIELKSPMLSEIDCELRIYRKDINDLVSELSDIDLTYYDPPYNQHPYGSNYFMLNIINDYKKPDEISNISGIPKNWNKSSYNKRIDAEEAMDNLIKNTPSKYILISYNNEGIIPEKRFGEILKKHGKVNIMRQVYNTYKGSRNLNNRSTKTEELLWIVKK